MPFMFILVVGILLGFMLYGILKQWIRGCEAAQRASIAREEANAEEEPQSKAKKKAKKPRRPFTGM